MAELSILVDGLSSLARPGEEIEVYAAHRREVDVRVYDGNVESLAATESSGVGVRVIVDRRQGFSYVGDLSLGAEALAEARDNAEFASADEWAGIALPDGVAPAALDLFDERLGGVATDTKVALALELDRAVRHGDPRVRQVVSCDYGDSEVEVAIASSAGIRAESRETTCYLSTDLVAGDGDESQTGVGYTVARSPGDLDPEKAARDAITRATRLLGARKPHSDRLSIVLDRRVTATFLSILASALSGEEVAKGRSLFNGRLGEEVAASAVSLVDNPTNPLAFGAAVYDAEGLASRRTPLINEGILRGFLQNTYSARRSGTTSTASAVRASFKSAPGVGARAIELEPGNLGEEEVRRLVGDGLFVQGISGVHSGVNRISGDFSVGAEGLMIRGGELAEPVREITIASTIQKMLQQVLAVGSDVEWLPSVAAGVSLAIGDVAMSGG